MSTKVAKKDYNFLCGLDEDSSHSLGGENSKQEDDKGRYEQQHDTLVFGNFSVKNIMVSSQARHYVLMSGS